MIELYELVLILRTLIILTLSVTVGPITMKDKLFIIHSADTTRLNASQ